MNNSQRKTNTLKKILVSFLIVLLPGLVIWFFFSGDWNGDPILRYGYVWMISLGFVFITTLIIVILIKTKFVYLDILNFTIPISILMMLILLTYPLSNWTRALIVLPTIIVVTLPVNMLVARISEEQDDKNRNEEYKYD